MIKYLLLPLIFLNSQAAAQKIYGTVFNDKGDLLPYASITIKGTSAGAVANNRAKFSFTVNAGVYTLVCQHIGFTRQEKVVSISKTDEEITFVLSPQKLELKEVIVKSGDEDPAYEIIRNAIKKRELYNKQVNGFDCDLYTKDVLKVRSLPNKIMGKKIPEEDRKSMMLDSSGKGIIYLAESVAKLHTQQPDKFKMEVLSSRVSGSGGFGFTFPTFISLYNSNVKIFTEKFNPRGFISPIADGAISFYRFKYMGSFFEDNKEIHTIKITPRRNFEPLFAGIINITEGDWRIHSFDLELTKKAQLEIIDTLKITQIHVPVSNDVWRVKNQQLYFNFNQMGIDAVGNFVNVYSNYEINPVYPKKYFDKIVVKYDTAVNKKSKDYWDTIRPVPLAMEEKNDYQIRDSVFNAEKNDMFSKRSIDSLKKSQGKLNPLDIFWKGISRNHYSAKRISSWGIESLIKHAEYNSVEGAVINGNFYYNTYSKKIKSNISFQQHVRYGFSNTHLNAWANIVINTRDAGIDKKIKRQFLNLAGGKRVSQFNLQSPILPLSNTINTLFWGNNFMKIYENWFVNPGFFKRYESGLRFGINVLYENRMPLENTTNYTVFKKDSVNIKPNFPYEKMTQQFTRHQALIVSFDISIKPGQKYIQFPKNKVAIGSKYPTFSFNYTKGIKSAFGSDVDFDKWRFTVNDNKNFKLAGELKYKIGMGGFINTRNVPLQDFQHFNGNRYTGAGEYVNTFQLASFYGNSTTEKFFSFAHIEHHFNGLLTNKIPGFRKLNWNLVGGANALYTNRKNNYAEVFFGFENIFKVLRVDYVIGQIDGQKTLSGFRIGFGGVIGENIKVNKKANTVSISL